MTEIIKTIIEGLKISDKVILTHDDLPVCHIERENIADALTENYLVKVERFGTGNGRHSGIIAGCGVYAIEVAAR